MLRNGRLGSVDGGRRVKTVNVTLKSIGGAITVIVAYVNHTLTPLFWALLILASLDVLLNVHKEGMQLQKVGSAFASIGGTVGLANHVAQPDFLRVAVAVATLAYLQVVVPQIVSLLGKIKFSKDPATNNAVQEAEIAALRAEVERLRQIADQQAGVKPGGNDGLQV